MMIAVDDSSPLAYDVFVRTLQFGALSPVFTSWGNKDEPRGAWRLFISMPHATRSCFELSCYRIYTRRTK